MVRTIVDLGHNLNRKVIAEGIETWEQLHAVRRLGCDLGQGFLFSRPVQPERTLALLADRPRAARSLRSKTVRARELRRVV
jgi:EAL domain-containing protein (putative c-di-GMP-specific phosphodiesterase class I)